jgi:hypothetical protein
MHVTSKRHGARFFAFEKHAGKLVHDVTPLFVVLMLVEITQRLSDVVSIGTIFASITDPFIVLPPGVVAATIGVAVWLSLRRAGGGAAVTAHQQIRRLGGPGGV